MGDVVDLRAAREIRTRRRRAIAHQAVMHPALRWVVGDDTEHAHRRTPAGLTACGASGPLLLAPRGVPVCPACYPVAR